MKQSVEKKIEEAINSFKNLINASESAHCRLVQYSGIEMIGAFDLDKAEIENQIKGLISEGFYVAWDDNDGIIYLKAWEYDGPEPPWEKVFNAEDIEQIEIPDDI